MNLIMPIDIYHVFLPKKKSTFKIQEAFVYKKHVIISQ
jgi:hypothetical protein